VRIMRYWLDLFTPFTWNKFQEHGSNITGFRPRQRNAAFERVEPGDNLLCYLVKLSRWCGVLEVASDAFEDNTPIFAEANDPFPIRFKVLPKIVLHFENAIPIQEPEFWDKLSFTRSLPVGSMGWAQRARLRQSLVEISSTDGELIVQALKKQEQEKRVYGLDAADRRHLTNRTVVRTEEGEVEVEVPEREVEEQLNEVVADETRQSLRVQAKVAQLGVALGFTIWVPPGDRNKILERLPGAMHEKLVTTLPLNYDLATLRTIENIDVIWLDRRAIAHAFEVEHTTSVYSGLLRMADLLAMQPRMNISLHIIAPTERRDRVRREIVRPVFSILEGGAMYERCSFLAYEAVDEILGQPNLSYLRETILEAYEEYFEP
jgi:hypothetical protein